MKLSKYNFFFDYDENTKLIFNCLTGGFAKLDKKTYDNFLEITSKVNDKNAIKRYERNKAFKELINELKRGGFIIEDSFEEIDFLKLRNLTSRFDATFIGLTVVLNLSCNFKCIYCYEHKNKKFMSRKTKDRLIDLIKTQAKKLKALHITWYGSEPLLSKRTLYDLSEKFIKICESEECFYGASMVTNGYLLTKRVASKLKEHQISNIQITLDGPKEVHDLRRPLVNGKGSFDKILTNLTEIVDLFKISIRVNVDTTNFEKVPELLDILTENGLRNKLKIYFAQTTPYTPACKDFSEFCFNDREYSEIEIRLYSIALKHGFLVSKHPRITSNYCGAVTLNSHVIDPSGLLYKCWDTIGMEEESVGNINQLHTTLNSNVFKWLLWDPFEFEKCKNCDVLPICLGGCPYRALYVKPSPHPKCDSWKYNLKDMLELIYLSKLKSSDNKKISTET